MQLNAKNQFAAGNRLYTEKDIADSFCLVLKGKVRIFTNGFSCVAGAGSIIGSTVPDEDGCSYNCEAVDDVTAFAFANTAKDPLKTVFGMNKDYGGLAIYNYAKMVKELSAAKDKLMAVSRNLYDLLKNGYARYTSAARAADCRSSLIPEIAQLEPYAADDGTDTALVEKSLEIAKIPYDILKAYYGCSARLAVDTATDLRMCLATLGDACCEISDYVHNAFMILIGNPDYSFFRSVLCLGLDIKKKKASTAEVEALAEECLSMLKEVKGIETSCTGRKWDINESAITGMKDAFADGRDFRTSADENSSDLDTRIVEEMGMLKNSFEQLLEYGRYPAEKTEDFRKTLQKYIDMTDRESTDDEFRKLRKTLAEHFYDLYSRVYLTTRNGQPVPKAADLMLNFGYLSEKLLTEEQMAELLRIPPINKDAGRCGVYTMREWLDAVYTREKEPSRNDMGQDFSEHIRELKKQGQILAGEEKAYMEDPEKCVMYEINNVLSHGNRIVNGQLSTFVPILHSEQLIGELAAAYSTAEKINATVEEILKIDFSVFYRESLYVNPQAGIDRELIMKEVLPIFIIYPTAGTHVIMWQEITGRKRDSEGRFLVPSFTFSSLRDMMVKSFGQFRWDLCKTIQGTSWNNIQVHSLTSEYSDYIQFYKKNHELSDERKERVKLQIQRGRNNLREVFSIDYEAWIKSEATGAMKLNKVAREIIATNCPFTAALRENLMKTPAYAEAFARYTREFGKKEHELDLRYRALESKGIVVPEELRITYAYYKEL